MIQLKR
ncbi:hypothetical protein ACTFIT_003238 [Dictyostelium discoideum]